MAIVEDPAILEQTSEALSTDRGDEAPGPIIRVDSIWKVFGKNADRVFDPENAGKSKPEIQSELGAVVGLNDVSFEVHKGQTFVIMGLSGSGKSTMVRCLIRLIEPTAGTIVIDGNEITAMNEKELMEFRRGKIAMVFQHYGLMPHRNVLENASWGLQVQGVPEPERQSRTSEILEMVGLRGWEEAYPRQLSGGMQQRVGLARALVVDTDILLMDEPFSGLDPLIRRQMQDELLRLQEDLQKTIVFITHDLNEALKLGDRIAIMQDGRIVQTGSPEDIVLRPEDEYVGDFTQDVRLESVLTASKVMVPPKATVLGHQGPRAALHTIGESDGQAAWVVDRNERYIGMLSITNAERALRAGISRIDQDWSYVDREYPAVKPTTTFDELIPKALLSDYPIPVVDSDDTLVGVFRRSSLAEAIAETFYADPDYEANAAENAALAAEGEAESQIDSG